MLRHMLCALALAIASINDARAAEPATTFSIDLLRPVYRGNIYATESIGEIVARINLPQSLQTDTKQVECRLVDKDQNELSRTVVPVAAIGEVKLPAADLAIGTYTFIARALGKNDRELAKTETAIRKLPPASGNEVRIDENGSIVVNGKPTVFIGWYGRVSTDDPRPDVVALQNIQTPVVVGYPNKEGIAKSFNEHGIYSVVSLEPHRLRDSFNLAGQPNNPVLKEFANLHVPSAERLDYLKKMIELVRDEPGTVAYYLADEPEINDIRADYLEALYRAIRELDPYHPVIVTNDTIEGIEQIGYRCCDILSPDPYSMKPSYVPSFMQKAVSVMLPGQSLMLTPWHSCGHTHWSRNYGSDPPYPFRTMRSQMLASVAYGARGLTGYTSDFFLPEPTLRLGLPRVWREIQFLEPAMATPAPVEPVAVEPAKDVVAWLRKSGEHVYLIVMNFGETRSFTIRHPLLSMPALPVISEARNVNVTGGAISDEIASGETHIYSTDPRGLELPTIAADEAEIAAFEQAAIKPGNLLHASQGTKARASKGTYLPWFAHMYWYAINGITDDYGWFVTHAELPQFFELTLSEAKPIGRVVIYTPNLQDYDLQFRSADGAVQQAEVRGNKATVVEHRLEQPISTLKLRIVARATSGTVYPMRGAMVREIEAYTEPGTGLTLAVHPVEAPAEIAAEIVDTVLVAEYKPLWFDDFSHFVQKPNISQGSPEAWAFNPENMSVTHEPGKPGLVCTSKAAQGYSWMARMLPYDPQYRFFQVNVNSIDGDGYRWAGVDMIDPAGKPTRTSVMTMKPGRYTVDTHYLNEAFRTGEIKNAFVRLHAHNGVNFGYEGVSLSRTPIDGLSVTLPDGSPLPKVLKPGNQLLFRLYLEQPATDAVVELMHGSYYIPVHFNGEPYVQLLKSGLAKDGRYWSSVVKLGPTTNKFKSDGYPLLFRAVMTGGPLRQTFVNVSVDFE